MTSSEQHKLIDGIFNAEDAKEILCHLINKKINFHNCRILSLHERFGIKDEYAQKRIKELEATKREMLNTIDQAAKSGMHLEVFSTVQLNLTTKATTSKQVPSATLSMS